MELKPPRPAVFLDRDGVLNKLVERDGGLFSPRYAEDFDLYPWAASCTADLANAGYLLVVVTNQPDISRGKMLSAELDKMHMILQSSTKVDAIYVCQHDEQDECDCRKPKIGMFLSAAEELNIDLANSWTIGDRETDLLAGRTAGTKSIYIVSGQERITTVAGALCASTLLEATELILAK